MINQTDNLRAWQFNCSALLYEILLWKKKFIEEELRKNAMISKDELIQKIKKEKERKFKDSALFLVRTHPTNTELQCIG